VTYWVITKTQAEIASKYGLHPTQQNNWKKDFMERWEWVFETKDTKEEQCKKEVEKRESTIGHYAYKVQWLEKNWQICVGMTREKTTLRKTRKYNQYLNNMNFYVYHDLVSTTTKNGQNTIKAALKKLGYSIGRKKARSSMKVMWLCAL